MPPPPPAPAARGPLRVAICHPDLGIGGAERLIVDAAVELAARGHAVHVFTAHHDPSRCFEETVTGRFPVSVYGDFLPRHIFYRFHAICAYLRCCYVALAMILWWPHFDVVLADQVSAVIPILHLAKGSKVLFYCHYPDKLLATRTTAVKQLYRQPIDWIEQVTTGQADQIVVNSTFTAETFSQAFQSLSSRGLKPAVLYPAVDVAQYDSIAPPTPPKRNMTSITRAGGNLADIPGLPADSRIFLSINRFERKKGVELAILAYGICKRREMAAREQESPAKRLDAYGDVKLVIAGGYDPRLRENRDYLSYLMRLAEEEGVSNSTFFLPSFTMDQKVKLLSASVCVVYTPQNEHFGIVPLEAMAARRPVIACNSGGPCETVEHNSTGFLCDPTPKSFAAAMVALIDQPNRAQVMGQAARRHVENRFSRTIFGDHLDQLVRDLAA
eukprot:SM000127S26643  [mRNA]  locus=s127:200907:203569:+ [translate_table: standard]